MKSGNLNFLEPSGLVQACNGTALPNIYNIYIYIYKWAGGAKISWGQGRKVPKYGPAHVYSQINLMHYVSGSKSVLRE